KVFYEKQLAQMVTGPGVVKTVMFKDGRVVIQPTGRPELIDATDGLGGKLQARDTYQKTYSQLEADIVQEMDALAKWLKPEIWAKLPKKDGILDVAAALKILKAADFDDKGLFMQDADVTSKITEQRALLFQEQEKRERVLAEQEYLKPLLVNTAVESDLLTKRLTALRTRVDELKKSAGIASSR